MVLSVAIKMLHILGLTWKRPMSINTAPPTFIGEKKREMTTSAKHQNKNRESGFLQPAVADPAPTLQPKLQQKHIVLSTVLLQRPQLLQCTGCHCGVSSSCYRNLQRDIQSAAKPKRICRPQVNLLFSILRVAKTGRAHSMRCSKQLFLIIWPLSKTKTLFKSSL